METNSIKKYIPKKYAVAESGNCLSFEVPLNEVTDFCTDLYSAQGLTLKSIVAFDERKEGNGFKIRYIFGAPGSSVYLAPYITLVDSLEFPSLSNSIAGASLYERKIQTFFGLTPKGHPDPRPLILHENWPSDVFPMRKDFAWNERSPNAKGQYQFRQVIGEGIYEIPVGPVHAGIIEPGHFRFSVAGEEIVNLEAKLGFVHKGTEKLFEHLLFQDKVRLSERVSGDTSFTHSLAFCEAVEILSGADVPERARYLRVAFSELERLANHLGDIGFIMLDTGFSFGGSNGARLREHIMRIAERISGSRYWRGVNTPGGVTKDISPDEIKTLRGELAAIGKDFEEVIALAEESSSLYNRLDGTGTLKKTVAEENGMVGIAARAVGIECDARVDHPYAAYKSLQVPVALETSGDVRARFYVRIREVRSSLALIESALTQMPRGVLSVAVGAMKKNSLAVGITEGWRGEIVYVVATDDAGHITRVSVRDPSFLNWTALPHAALGNVVPDFPLINKSFNLSYSGFDL